MSYYNVVPLERTESNQGPDEIDLDDEDPIVFVSNRPTNLSVFQAATLLAADCLGTGILALPNDMKVLGKVLGVGFLVWNLPINLYAGSVLSQAAERVEERSQHQLVTVPPPDEETEQAEEEEATEVGITHSCRVVLLNRFRVQDTGLEQTRLPKRNSFYCLTPCISFWCRLWVT